MSSYRPEEAESLYLIGKVQDGVHPHNHSDYTASDFMLSLDLQDTYLHISILPAFQRYLRFAIGQTHLQFTSLPFGLMHISKDIHKSPYCRISPAQSAGAPGPPGQARNQKELLSHREILIHTLVYQFQNVPTQPNPAVVIGSTLRYCQHVCLDSIRESSDSQEENLDSGNFHSLIGLPVPQSSGHHIIVYPNDPLGTLAPASVLLRLPSAVEEAKLSTANSSVTQYGKEPTVVAKGGVLQEITTLG